MLTIPSPRRGGAKEVLTGSAASSRMLEVRGPLMVRGVSVVAGPRNHEARGVSERTIAYDTRSGPNDAALRYSFEGVPRLIAGTEEPQRPMLQSARQGWRHRTCYGGSLK